MLVSDKEFMLDRLLKFARWF